MKELIKAPAVEVNSANHLVIYEMASEPFLGT